MFPAFQQDAPPPPPAAEAKVQALRERLRSGPGPVRIVVFGDSLAAGWGPRDPKTEAYPAVFAQALQARYPDCALEVIWAGGPGDASDVGLIRLGNEVLRRKPDVVVIQFGGNDERLKRPARDLEDDLVEMVGRIHRALPEALCLVATPPMNDPGPGSPYVRAAVLAAQASGAPVADLDGALRAGDRDFRGPFCWGGHPGAFSHLLMGRELVRAWDTLMGTPAPLRVRIEGYSRMLQAGEAPSLRVQVENLSEADLTAELEVSPALLAIDERLTVRPGSAAGTEQRIVLPALGSDRRTRVFRLSALARSVEAEASDLDTKWLAVAPVVTPDQAQTAGDTEPRTWHAFGADSLVKGAGSWGGDGDLSGRFGIVLDEERLAFVVEVTDDNLDTAHGTQHLTDGDSVEVCLDLRPPADQGKPVYSPDVVLLIVKPGVAAGEAAAWEPLDELAPRIAGVTARSGRTADGYRVRLSVPRDGLRSDDDGGLEGIGFDVHLNDSDFGFGRERQMVWAGTQDNYLDPSGLAALAAPNDDPPRWRATLR